MATKIGTKMYGYLQMDSDRVIVWQPIKTPKYGNTINT